MSTNKLPPSSNPTRSDQVDWAAEIQHTLEVTGWTKAELARRLGLYVQQKGTSMGGPVSPHLYAWIRGQYKPKLYLLFALRYIRLTEGKPLSPNGTPPTNPTE